MSDSTLRRWLDGETKVPLAAEYRNIEKKPAKKRPPRVGDRERLGGFGILRYFTYIVSSWDVGAMKPDPRIFETALERAGCPPHEAVMIGDRLDNDVAPAKALGMKTVRVRQGFGSLQSPRSEAETPDFEIGSLSELPALFL